MQLDCTDLKTAATSTGARMGRRKLCRDTAQTLGSQTYQLLPMAGACFVEASPLPEAAASGME